MKQFFTAYAVLVAILVVPALASAEPYDLFARFTPSPTAPPTAKTFEMNLQTTGTGTDAFAIIPRSGMDYILDGVFIRLRTDDISKSALLNYEKLSFDATCDGCRNLKPFQQISTRQIPLIDKGAAPLRRENSLARSIT